MASSKANKAVQKVRNRSKTKNQTSKEIKNIGTEEENEIIIKEGELLKISPGIAKGQ